jgi:hypothetical protein
MQVGFTMAQNPRGMWRGAVDAEATWHPGRRHYSLFGLIQSTEQPFKIDTYRCVKCGYLESYAITAPDNLPVRREPSEPDDTTEPAPCPSCQGKVPEGSAVSLMRVVIPGK